jgi:hypothetical protein
VRVSYKCFIWVIDLIYELDDHVASLKICKFVDPSGIVEILIQSSDNPQSLQAALSMLFGSTNEVLTICWVSL